MRSENLLNLKLIKYRGIPLTRVVNSDYLDSLKDIYKCNICFKIMINPTDCEKCGHSYCYDCIADSQCPFNCENCEIRPSSIGIKLILNNLIFKCENENCPESISYSSIINHNMQCIYRPIKCPNLNCGINLQKKNLQNHIEKECRFTIEKCKYCGYEFPRCEMKTHVDSCESIFQCLNFTTHEDINTVINNSGDSININSTSHIYNSSISTAKKDFSKIKAKSYLEALSINLSKIVKENNEKYKTLQEENNKIKHEYNNEVKDLLTKMNKKLQNLKGKDFINNNKNLNGYSNHDVNFDGQNENNFQISDEENISVNEENYLNTNSNINFNENENDKEKEKNNNCRKISILDDVKSKAFFNMENIYSNDKNNKIEKMTLIEPVNDFETINDHISNDNINFNNDLVTNKNKIDISINKESKFLSSSKKSHINKIKFNLKNSETINDEKENTKNMNMFMEYLKEVLQKHIQDDLANGLNDNFKNYINEHEEKMKEVFISQNMENNIRFNEEIVKTIKQIVKLSEDNLKSFLKDIKSYIIEEFKDQIKATNSIDLIKKIDNNTKDINENFTNFNIDIGDLKRKFEFLLESKNKINYSNNMESLEKEEEPSKENINNKLFEENINFLKEKTEEIEKYIKKIYEENIKEFINSNNPNYSKQQNYNMLILFEDFQKNLIELIQDKIETKNNIISNFIEESIIGLKNIIQNNFEKTFQELNKWNKNQLDKREKIEKNLCDKYDESVEELGEKININIEKLTSNFLKNVIETFDDKIEELKSFIEEKIEKQTKEINLNFTNETLKSSNIECKSKNDIYLNEKNDLINDNIITLNKNINEYENKIECIISKFENNINEEFEAIKNDINTFSKNNKEIKSIITEEFGELSEVLKDIKNNNKKLDQFELESIEKKNEKERLNSKLSEELIDKKINIIYDKIIKNITHHIDDGNRRLTDFVKEEIVLNNKDIKENLIKNEKKIIDLNENVNIINNKFEKIEGIADKIDNLHNGVIDEINNFSQNTEKIIIFNQMDLIIKIKENSEDLKNQTEVNNENTQSKIKNYLTLAENEYSRVNANAITKEYLAENNQKLKCEIAISIESKLKEEIECLDLKIENKLNQKLKEFYELKWCKQCEKIDYNFSFTQCKICKNDNCKSCIKLCKICKTLNCIKCVNCPKCSEISCINCRSDCYFCSEEKKEKFCRICLKNCFFCKKSTCMDCTRQCLKCSNVTCGECARLCRICQKCSCRRCETIKNFKNCFNCKETACNECIVECTECNLEVCNNCFNSCKNCNKLLCKKCGIDCENCGDIFCDRCAKDLNQNNCHICNKLFCISCVKYLRRCKKCGGDSCKNCCANCLKCKNVFCKSCNVNCDNCEDYACVLCVYKCACEKLIFCEKCLFGICPISPPLHSCVLWLNESPIFSGIKSRSKIALPKNFEAKFYLERFDSINFLIGITDNSDFNEDTLSFIDNIWGFKPKTGQKYSSKKSLENYYNKEAREKDFIIIAIKNDNLYFRVNFDDNPPAYHLPQNREYYIYIENDTMLSSLKVKFIYLRKI